MLPLPMHLGRGARSKQRAELFTEMKAIVADGEAQMAALDGDIAARIAEVPSPFPAQLPGDRSGIEGGRKVTLSVYGII